MGHVAGTIGGALLAVAIVVSWLALPKQPAIWITVVLVVLVALGVCLQVWSARRRPVPQPTPLEPRKFIGGNANDCTLTDVRSQADTFIERDANRTRMTRVEHDPNERPR
jgi:hypothetical protein